MILARIGWGLLHTNVSLIFPTFHMILARLSKEYFSLVSPLIIWSSWGLVMTILYINFSLVCLTDKWILARLGADLPHWPYDSREVGWGLLDIWALVLFAPLIIWSIEDNFSLVCPPPLWMLLLTCCTWSRLIVSATRFECETVPEFLNCIWSRNGGVLDFSYMGVLIRGCCWRARR